MIKKILVPLDGSPSGEAVLPEIESLAEKFRAEVILLKVVASQVVRGSHQISSSTGPSVGNLKLIPSMSPSPSLLTVDAKPTSEFAYDLISQDVLGAEDYLSTVAQSLTKRGLKISTVTRHGKTAESILSFAREEGVDLIAMSSRARSRASKVLRASVPEKVMRESKVPVILTKPTPAAMAKAKLLHYQVVMAN